MFSMLFAALGILVPKEHVSAQQWAAGGVILIGLVLAGLFGPSCNSAVTTDVLSEALKPGTIIFTAGALVAVVASLVVWQCAKQPGPLRTLVLLLGSALCAGFASLDFKICVTTVQQHFDEGLSFLEIIVYPWQCMLLRGATRPAARPPPPPPPPPTP